MSLVDDGSAGSECGGESGHRLDANFDGFHRTEGNVGEKFGRCRGGQVQTGAVHVRVLFTQSVGVDDFECLVESKLAHTLF